MAKRSIYSYRDATFRINEDDRIEWHKPISRTNIKRQKTFGDITDIREAIFKRDNHKCFYCGSEEKLYLDHVMPKSIFKWHDVYNLISCCKKCNFGKNNKLLLEPLLHKVLSYLIKANKCFTEETKSNFKLRLTYYFEGNESCN